MIKTALITAAGRGLRLDRPGTPKPLVDVDGQPILFRLIRQLKSAGVENIVVVTGFESEKIEQKLFRHPHIAQGVKVLENSQWSMGLASSVASAEEFILNLNESDPFLLVMGDHVFDEELLVEAVSSKLETGEGALFVTKNIEAVYDYESAVKVCHDNGIITKLGRGIDCANGVDMGVFLLKPSIFDALRLKENNGHTFEWSDAIGDIVNNKKLSAIETEAVFDDIDTPSSLVHCEMRLRKIRREAVLNRPVYPSNSESFTTFDYIIDTPVKTDIVVGRGFVKDPSKLQIIKDQSASSPIFVFTDETVAEIYGYDFKKKLVEFGYNVNLIVLPVGEESKSLTNYAYLVERVLRKGVDEQSVFISLGGGVVCNVCGFVASSIYRGLNLVHLPTTLMAQSDAAVSHKQGINGYQGKNLVGSYYSPQMVAIDVETLNTLPLRLVADGMAEVIKHAVGQDESYVDMLLAHNGDLRDLDFIEAAIRRNVHLKCELVLNDPKEHNEAMILQYGHTVGHPVEHLTGYSYYHGESVAVGMSVAARISHIMGGCSADLIKLQDEINDKFKLPSRIPSYIKPDSILETMKYNKKFLSGGTRMALLQGVGKLWSVNGDYAIPVSDKVLLEAVEASMEK